MRLTRKMLSLSTIGTVDFRSDKERTAAYTKATKKQAKQQTRIMREQLALTQARGHVNPQEAWVAGPPTGWYDDAHDPTMRRFWSGTESTQYTKRAK